MPADAHMRSTGTSHALTAEGKVAPEVVPQPDEIGRAVFDVLVTCEGHHAALQRCDAVAIGTVEFQFAEPSGAIENVSPGPGSDPGVVAVVVVIEGDGSTPFSSVACWRLRLTDGPFMFACEALREASSVRKHLDEVQVARSVDRAACHLRPPRSAWNGCLPVNQSDANLPTLAGPPARPLRSHYVHPARLVVPSRHASRRRERSAAREQETARFGSAAPADADRCWVAHDLGEIRARVRDCRVNRGRRLRQAASSS